MKPGLILIYPLLPEIEAGLEQRFEVHRWHCIADKAGFLVATGRTIAAVVTGGHLGLPAEMIEALPELSIIAINGVGYDKVDLDLARRRGIAVTNTPGLMAEDVADLAIGLIIGFNRMIAAGDAYVRDGRWRAGEMALGRKVSGARFGIFGLGGIGTAIARRLEGFGGTIGYASRSPHDLPYRSFPSLLALAAWSDVLVLAAPATAETRGIVGRAVLDVLGPDGLLVNVARGALVDEAELSAALREGRLRGAALDVFENEPEVSSELLAEERLLAVPHVGAATTETRREMGLLVLANLDAHVAGTALPSRVA